MDEYIADVLEIEGNQDHHSLVRAARQLRAHESWLSPWWLDEEHQEHRGSVSRRTGVHMRSWTPCASKAQGEIPWR